MRGAQGEAEVSRVELDSHLHVVDDVADARHIVFSPGHGGVIPLRVVSVAVPCRGRHHPRGNDYRALGPPEE